LSGNFLTPYDIANRALDHVGVRAISTFADSSIQAERCSRIYDKLRLAELQRNNWSFAIKRTVLRPVSATSVEITFAAYNAATTYAFGDIVSYGNLNWVSRRDSNTGNTPGAALPTTGGTLYWDTYFGTLHVDVWNGTQTAGSSENESYDVGELVYKTPGDGTYKVYRSLVGSNTEQPDAVDVYEAGVMYATGAVVSYDGTNYQSQVNLNFNNTPSATATQWSTTITSALVSNKWAEVAGATIAALKIIWPVASGPLEDQGTRNIYRLPSGFLKDAPQKPKAGVNAYLGIAGYLPLDDYEINGIYLVTVASDAIPYRFVADFQDVPNMSPLFCEGLAARMGFELSELSTQNPSVVQVTNLVYERTIFEARQSNAIEQGSVEEPLDLYLSVRV
jgi:hypothetical protein